MAAPWVRGRAPPPPLRWRSSSLERGGASLRAGHPSQAPLRAMLERRHLRLRRASRSLRRAPASRPLRGRCAMRGCGTRRRRRSSARLRQRLPTPVASPCLVRPAPDGIRRRGHPARTRGHGPCTAQCILRRRSEAGQRAARTDRKRWLSRRDLLGAIHRPVAVHHHVHVARVAQALRVHVPDVLQAIARHPRAVLHAVHDLAAPAIDASRALVRAVLAGIGEPSPERSTLTLTERTIRIVRRPRGSRRRRRRSRRRGRRAAARRGARGVRKEENRRRLHPRRLTSGDGPHQVDPRASGQKSAEDDS